MEIRSYQKEDEIGWVRCRVLSFLDTAYYDNVLPHKERYENSAIELVAVEGETIIGLLDIEYEKVAGTICTQKNGLGGMIWHIAVHPDYRRTGIARKLLAAAEERSRDVGLTYLEAWTRDDEWVNNWYENTGFQKEDAYLHIYIDGEEPVSTGIPGLHPISTFAHYTGKNVQEMKSKFKRIHVCNGFIKELFK